MCTPGAVEADVVDDDQLGVDEPEHEAHRHDGQNESRHVHPAMLRTPRPGRVEHRHHHVVAEPKNGDREYQGSRTVPRWSTFAQLMKPCRVHTSACGSKCVIVRYVERAKPIRLSRKVIATRPSVERAVPTPAHLMPMAFAAALHARARADVDRLVVGQRADGRRLVVRRGDDRVGDGARRRC